MLKAKRSVPIAVTLPTADLKEIFVPNADWLTGNAPGAAFSSPPKRRLMSARSAMRIAPLSTLPVIHRIAAEPVTSIHGYCAE